MTTRKNSQKTWGGSRLGAGRKSGEKSKRISVPIGCLEEVLKIINNHKGITDSPSEHVRVAPAAIVSDGESRGYPRSGNTGGTLNIEALLEKSYEDFTVRRRSLNSVKGSLKKKIITLYGSIQKAANEGIYLSHDGVLKRCMKR